MGSLISNQQNALEMAARSSLELEHANQGSASCHRGTPAKRRSALQLVAPLGS